MEMPTSTRGYATGYFALMLDGVECGFIKSIEGGTATAEVIAEAAGPSAFVKKHLGPPKYEDIVIQGGFAMGKPVYDWIKAFLETKRQRKNGSIITSDATGKARSQQDFFNALITEITFPAIDAESRDEAYLTLKFAPEYTRSVKASGNVTAPTRPRAQKRWMPANFRLEIDGLDCSMVSRVESFTIRRVATTDDIGDARDYLKEPGRIEFPNLTITLAEVGAQSWMDWHEDFVIKGNNADAMEKKGALVFLAPNFKAELARINFAGLGIFRLAPEKAEARSDAVRRFKAELYCEQMTFEIKDTSA
jgi:phage tail-like protein